MKKRNLNRCEAFHEIGHGIVGYIFNGYVMELHGIIFDKNDLASIGLHPKDLAYTKQRNTKDHDERIKENEHLSAAVVGMNFLGGIAGATYLCPKEPPKKKLVTEANFNKILNIIGSEGDFEFINNKEYFYAWHLFSNGYNSTTAYEVHAKLMNVLQELFLESEIRNKAQKLYEFIETQPNANIELETFDKIFPKDFVKQTRAKLEIQLSKDSIGEFKKKPQHRKSLRSPIIKVYRNIIGILFK